MKAYSVSFNNCPDCRPGRSANAEYRTACVIASDIVEATKRAAYYCATKWPKFHISDISMEDDIVILGQFPKEWEDGR